MNKKNLAILVLLLAAGCADKSMLSGDHSGGGSAVNPSRLEESVPPMDPKRKVSEQDCGGPVDIAAGNLLCMGPEAAERARRARLEEEARQAKLRKEAEERAARERLERERAAQLAREEAARKAKLAEEERLAAERRRLEEEAALKARLERERLEREAAEALARQRAEQEKREAIERECRRLEQEPLEGRAMLQNFVSTYGNLGEFKEIAGQITAFLNKPRKPKPCP